MLVHRTVESGHTRISPRPEVSDDSIRRLRPVLDLALRLGREQPGPAAVEASPEWHVAAVEVEDGLALRLWYGVLPAGEPHIQSRLRLTGREAWMDTWLAGLLRIQPRAAQARAALQAGDLERCLAWTWLDGRTPPEVP